MDCEKRDLFIIIVICLAALACIMAIAIISIKTATGSYDAVIDVVPSSGATLGTSQSDNTQKSDVAVPPSETPTTTTEPTPQPSPTPQTTGADISEIDPEKPIVALTFDDGPGGASTSKILDLLEQYHVSATFFVVGDMINYHKDNLEREIALGFEIGNHTEKHDLYFKSATAEQIAAAIEPVDKAVVEAGGRSTYLVRPPGGSYSSDKLSEATRPYILWSVDTEDWKSRDKDMVFERVKADVFDGAIILMHDIHASTAEACELVIPWLVENGYQVVSVSQLFAARGIELVPGNVYRMAKKDGRFF